MTATPDQYWLGRWVDEYEVISRDQLGRLFDLPGPMVRLAELAAAAPTFNSPSSHIPDLSVAAGRGIDLGSYMSCGAFECMQKKVDSAYPNIFHYFDYLIVEGASPQRFLRQLRSLPKGRHDELHRELLEDISIILYLRDIGAYKYTIFREKPQAYCSKHMNYYAKTLGVPSYRDGNLLERAAQRLAKEAAFEMGWRKGVWTFWANHDFFTEPAMGTVARGKKRPPQPAEMAGLIIENYTGGSLADVVFASDIGAPLARAIDTTWIDNNADDATARESDVALHLNLPIIDGIKVKDLLLLREDEKPFFDNFRDALRRAIVEQIRLNDSAPPQEVARSVIRENIMPALADIDARLRVNQRKLSSKLGASLIVGTVITSAGLIGSLPLIVDTGVVAMAASLTHIYKYFDDYGDDVQLENMYFLWKAKKIASSGHSMAIAKICN
jgi:hypothetical protein